MKAKISVLIALVLILSFSLIGFGATIVEKIEANLANDMKFKVDGKMWQPLDVDGSPLYPIIYKGRSYVPARALLEAKDVKVGYDAATRTILLDYPEWEPPVESMDKSTPYLMRKLGSHSSEVDYSLLGIIKYELITNEDFDIGEMPLTNEITMDLADDAKIMINGKEISLKEFASDGAAYSIGGGGGAGKVSFMYDEKSKLITSVEMDGETWGDPHENLNGKKIKVDITLSGPPWTLTIKIRW